MSEPGTKRVRCGDCQFLLDLTRDRPAGLPIDPDQYCPHCWKGGARPVACPHCGSLVCAECGSILESAADLGLG